MSLRLGIDIDGVLADMEGGLRAAQTAGWAVPHFWETLDEIEPGSIKRLAAIAADQRWEVIFLTRRPHAKGATAQTQTQRWLAGHGFPLPSVYVVSGSRGKIASALGLDVVIDDRIENCLDVAIDSTSESVLIWPGEDALVRRSLRGLNVKVAGSFGECLDRLAGLEPSSHAPRRKRSSAPNAVVPSAHPVASAPARPQVPPTRRTYLISAVLFAAFAIYGSLVPFQFRPLPFAETFTRFQHTPYLVLGIASRADLVANILLFIPLGFLLTGALKADRLGWFGALLATVVVAATAFGLAVAIEFTQEFFPPRTVSLNDIFAETVGGAIGILIWLPLGQWLTEFLRASLQERERPALIVRILSLYAGAFLIAQFLPFDITIDLGELAQKYREGRIIFMPFSYAYPSTLEMLWDFSTDIALYAPIGALALLGWTVQGESRRPSNAIFLGISFVALVEVGQVFTFTRYADTTNFLTGLLGIALGVAAATAYLRTAPSPTRSSGSFQPWPAFGAIVWFGVVVAYHWYPFNFVFTHAMFSERFPILVAVPFRSYYFGSEFHAFTELSRKFMLALPLGALLRLAWPPRDGRWHAQIQTAILLGFTTAFFVGIEVGQIFLAERVPDLTDASIAEVGVIAGLWLVRLLARAEPAQRLMSAPHAAPARRAADSHPSGIRAIP